MDGTVNDIRGYPLYCLIAEARSPAAAAPINAATAAGIPVKSISSRRNVLAIDPINAAVAAIGMELLNIIEKPNTPQKLVISLRIRCVILLRSSSVKSCGCRCNSNAMIQAKMVATNTMMME